MCIRDSQFTEGLFATAQSGGPVTRSAYEALRGEFVRSYEENAPYDLALLNLHGAMTADGYDDCEGDLLRGLRRITGTSTVICAVLDPHCHLSDSMVRDADLLICSREYPHTDYPARMQELFELGIDIVDGKLAPIAAVFDCRMIGFYPTTNSPMRDFVDQLQEVERSDERILSASFVHGFELGDVTDTGSKMLVYTDDDPKLASETAQNLGVSIYKLRHALLPSFPDVQEAVATLRHTSGRTVIADVGDNPGAGFAADNMGILRELLLADFDHIVAGCFWDPMAVSICEEVGVGGTLALRVGGKSGPTSGPPMDLNVTVRAVRSDHRQPVFGVGTVSYGAVAWVSIVGADIVICSRREQVFSQETFLKLGIDLEAAKIILLKSGQHFYDSFAPLADDVLYVRAQDCVGLDLASIPHRVRTLDYFPRLDDPLGLD